MATSADISTGVGVSSHAPAPQERLRCPRTRASIRQAPEPRLGHVRRNDVLPRLNHD